MIADIRVLKSSPLAVTMVEMARDMEARDGMVAEVKDMPPGSMAKSTEWMRITIRKPDADDV